MDRTSNEHKNLGKSSPTPQFSSHDKRKPLPDRSPDPLPRLHGNAFTSLCCQSPPAVALWASLVSPQTRTIARKTVQHPLCIVSSPASSSVTSARSKKSKRVCHRRAKRVRLASTTLAQRRSRGLRQLKTQTLPRLSQPNRCATQASQLLQVNFVNCTTKFCSYWATTHILGKLITSQGFTFCQERLARFTHQASSPLNGGCPQQDNRKLAIRCQQQAKRSACR